HRRGPGARRARRPARQRTHPPLGRAPGQLPRARPRARRRAPAASGDRRRVAAPTARGAAGGGGRALGRAEPPARLGGRPARPGAARAAGWGALVAPPPPAGADRRGRARRHTGCALDPRPARPRQPRLRGPEVWVRRTGSELTIPGLAAGLASSADEPAWTVTLASADIVDGTLHHLDAESGAPSFDVTCERAHAGPLGAPEAAVPFSLAAVLGTGGRVSATGELVRAPGATKLHAELAALALPPLATLARSPLRLESGNASGVFDIAYGAGGAEASGTLVVADVKTISPDPARPED